MGYPVSDSPSQAYRTLWWRGLLRGGTLHHLFELGRRAKPHDFAAHRQGRGGRAQAAAAASCSAIRFDMNSLNKVKATRPTAAVATWSSQKLGVSQVE